MSVSPQILLKYSLEMLSESLVARHAALLGMTGAAD